MRAIPLAVLLGSTTLACSAALAQTAGQNAAAGQNACDRLVNTLQQQQGGDRQPVSLDQARTYQANNNQQACRDSLQRVQSAANTQQGQQNTQGQRNAQGQQTDGRIVVQQPAPTVRVDQATPQVTVNQPQPRVTVQQTRPEITVRMPPPTISVQQPPPEIVVRMPDPDVNVSTPQPRVAVNQPQPKVEVVQPKQQPDVRVERAEAQVQVQQHANQQADVQVERAQQPEVNFEQTGKPNIQYNMTGKPKVTFEQAEADASDRTGNTDARDSNVTTGAAKAGQQANVRPIAVERLKDMSLYNVRGDQLGDVERVVLGRQGKAYLVIGHGGFLGLGEKRVAIPMENVWHNGDRLVTRGLTDDQIKAMPDWNQQVSNYRELDNSQTAQVSRSE